MVYERRFYEKAFMNYIEFKFVHGISKILRAGLIECVWFARGGGLLKDLYFNNGGLFVEGILLKDFL